MRHTILLRLAKPTYPSIPSSRFTKQIRTQLPKQFSTKPPSQAKNRIFPSVRNPGEFENILTLSTSSRTPLITLWTASYCPTCKTVAPLLERMIESGVGETTEGNKVLYAEVEYDSPDMMAGDLGMRYMVTKLPSLICFDRGEVVERLVDGKEMTKEDAMKAWIEKQAERRGEGTSGDGGSSGGGGGFFGGLFGNFKK